MPPLVILCARFALGAVYQPMFLNDANFESELSRSPVTFVMSCTDDNPICLEIFPQFLQTAERLQSECQFAIINSHESETRLAAYGVRSAPAFLLFRGLKFMADYANTPRTDHMCAYLKRVLGPRVMIIDTDSHAQEYLTTHQSCIILGGDDLDPLVVSLFETLAAEFADILPFILVRTIQAMRRFGLPSTGAIHLARNDDRKHVAFPITTAADLSEQIRKELAPRWQPYNEMILWRIAQDPRITLMAFTNRSNSLDMDLVHDTFERVWHDFGDTFTYVYGDIHELEQYAIDLGLFELNLPVWCLLAVYDGWMSIRDHYSVGVNQSIPEIVIWLGSFIKAQGNRKIRTEAVTHGQPGPVFKLVGADFREATMITTMDVVIAILDGPDEGREHVIRVLNVAVVEFLKQNVTSMLFYHINAELNDLRGLTREAGHSVIMMWPGGEDRSPVRFEGDIDVKRLVTFVAQNAKTFGHFVIPSHLDL
jgi:hypothetical protein